MGKEGKFWFWLWSVIFTLIAVVIISAVYLKNKDNKTMASLGYERVSIMGNSQVHWQKVRNCD